MDCPYCNAELTPGYNKNVFKCPNAKGFSAAVDVLAYIEGSAKDLEAYCYAHGFKGWDEVRCESSKLGGWFFIDGDGELQDLKCVSA